MGVRPVTYGVRRSARSLLVALPITLAPTQPTLAGNGALDPLALVDVLESSEWLEQAIDIARERCAPRAPDEPSVNRLDFAGAFSLDAMAARSEQLYLSGKRPIDRAYFEPERERFELPTSLHFQIRAYLPLDERWIKSVIRHVETALYLRYANFINLMDMGHAHFLVPETVFEQTIDEMDQARQNEIYRIVSTHPQSRYLYHSAERVDFFPDYGSELPDGRFLQWRFYTRNLVGDNRAQGTVLPVAALEHSWNTVHSLSGYRRYGGFYLHANANGCFPYRDGARMRHFDLSLSYPPLESDALGWD